MGMPGWMVRQSPLLQIAVCKPLISEA
jgi:hypothetical protein